MSKLLISVFLFLTILFSIVFCQETDVLFKYYKNGQLAFVGNGQNVEQLENTTCSASDKFAFVIHGWLESCDTTWVPLLIQELSTKRGGCVICIDYRTFSAEIYPLLLTRFNSLTTIMTNKLKYLTLLGMNPDNTYLFGFSYGGQLAVAIGKSYGANQIKEIDTCDMAGIGFDFSPNGYNHRSAAKNVQCIHTSIDKGTWIYACHQNWRMGNCGYSQPAASLPPLGSHGLCPYFYISAFNNSFYAIRKPFQCFSTNPATSWPAGFKMGYMETRKSTVSGELFALTSSSSPYNVLPSGVTN